ncbi:MAG: DUF2177 family protein [Gemmatimonadota bacterium]|nr:DUF2177 family protein [Gemmatimonadota bacterium]
MRASTWLLTWAASLAAFLAIDLAWLGWIARGFYRDRLGALLRPDVNWTAALVFYALYVAAILLFAVAPALERGGLARAALLGVVFGGVAYATYDLTNLATLRDFPAVVAVVDIAWGCVLTGSVAAVGWTVAQRLTG